jgi:hypothetical protein
MTWLWITLAVAAVVALVLVGLFLLIAHAMGKWNRGEK